MNMKRYFYVSAFAAMALASCSSEDFLGDAKGNSPTQESPKAISFSGKRGNISRATEINGAEAAKALGNNFIVYGVKTKDNQSTTIYNYYNVNWVTDADDLNGTWKYEGQAKNNLNKNEGGQTLKYWDYSASNYDFTAFTLVSGVKLKRSEENGSPKYTFKGKVTELQSCYIADRITLNNPSEFGKAVQFKFHSTGTKVGLSIYETIPGYSIKDIQFYDESNLEEGDEARPMLKPTLYAKSACIPRDNSMGTLTVTYDENNYAKTELTRNTGEDTEDKVFSIGFKRFVLNAEKESNETTGNDTKYLGRTKDAATSTGAITVSPCKITDGLTLKVDYTLISIDGSGEEITVKGATATIPEEYTNWETNHIYNYVFRITEDSNGSTGDGGVGLKPIVFDAVVIEDANGNTTTETEIKK